jgi:hypothetical protein
MVKIYLHSPLRLQGVAPNFIMHRHNATTGILLWQSVRSLMVTVLISWQCSACVFCRRCDALWWHGNYVGGGRICRKFCWCHVINSSSSVLCTTAELYGSNYASHSKHAYGNVPYIPVNVPSNNVKQSLSSPIGLWKVEDRTFSEQSARKWRWGCQHCAPAALCPPEWFCDSYFC